MGGEAQPDATVIPETAEALCECVGSALETRRRLRIVGHRTRQGVLPLVAPPFSDLSLAKLDHVVQYEPEELVLTVQAGVALSTIDELLSAHGQHLGFEPPHFRFGGHVPKGSVRARGTIGGVVGSGFSGSRRPFSGSVRDSILGVHAVNGRGEIFKAGGRVVKNVTGYDLGKLLCGSAGSLAAVSEATFKVLPVGESVRTLVVTDLSDEGAGMLMGKAASMASAITGAAHLPACAGAAAIKALAGVCRAGQAVTLLRVEGTQRRQAERVRALASALDLEAFEQLDGDESIDLWRAIGDAEPLNRADIAWVWRITAPPAEGPRIAAHVARDSSVYYFDWAGALVWWGFPKQSAFRCQDAAAVHRQVREMGARAIVLHTPPDERAVLGASTPEPAPLAAMLKHIKQAFDPHGIFGPEAEP